MSGHKCDFHVIRRRKIYKHFLKSKRKNRLQAKTPFSIVVQPSGKCLEREREKKLHSI